MGIDYEATTDWIRSKFYRYIVDSAPAEFGLRTRLLQWKWAARQCDCSVQCRGRAWAHKRAKDRENWQKASRQERWEISSKYGDITNITNGTIRKNKYYKKKSAASTMLQDTNRKSTLILQTMKQSFFLTGWLCAWAALFFVSFFLFFINSIPLTSNVNYLVPTKHNQ